jgi:hypothetical protein
MPRIRPIREETNRQPRLKKAQFGACNFARHSPEALSVTTPAVNLVISFEDALKLNLAVDECVHQLGRFNRATAAGKNSGLMLVIHFDKKRIRVLAGKVIRLSERQRSLASKHEQSSSSATKK